MPDRPDRPDYTDPYPDEKGVNAGRRDFNKEVETYLTNELKDAVESATWNREKGLLTEAYGWECKVVFIGSMAHDHRMTNLSNQAEGFRIALRDAREDAQRKVSNA